MAALVASRHHPRIAACYRRLCAARKPKKVALTACMQKLLTILNAIVRQRTPWTVQTALDSQDNCSVFLKRPERIMALAFIMVLCLLVYRLAEWRLRQQLAASDQTVPNQLKQPTNRPTMRWMFECFEGISLLTLPSPSGPQTLVHGLELLHQLVLSLLGPSVSKIYESSN